MYTIVAGERPQSKGGQGAGNPAGDQGLRPHEVTGKWERKLDSGYILKAEPRASATAWMWQEKKKENKTAPGFWPKGLEGEESSVLFFDIQL